MEAPYCWNLRGQLMANYYHLGRMKHPNGDEYIWSDEILKPMLRDNNVQKFRLRHEVPELFGANGVRQRAPKQIRDKHDIATGRFMKSKDTPEGRELSRQIKDHLLYVGVLHNKSEDRDRLSTGRRHLDTEARDLISEKVATSMLMTRMAGTWREANKELLTSAVKTQAQICEVGTKVSTLEAENDRLKQELAEVKLQLQKARNTITETQDLLKSHTKQQGPSHKTDRVITIIDSDHTMKPVMEGHTITAGRQQGIITPLLNTSSLRKNPLRQMSAPPYENATKA